MNATRDHNHNHEHGYGHPTTATADSVDPHDYIGVKHATISWVLTGVATAFLALRIYCKQWRHRGLWWDDYILLASWLALVVQTAILTKQLDYDLGRHIWDLSTLDYTDDFELLGLIGVTSIVCGMVWSKTAFAVTLLRISEGRLRLFLWFVILTINIFMLGGVLVRWLQCWPVQKGWEPGTDGTCWDETISINISIATAVYSGAMDLILAMVPWKVIWKLPMKPREKVGIALAMSMGVFAAATAFVKSAKIPKVAAGDFTYEVADLLTWGVAEVAVTIIAASIPVLRVLVLETAQPLGGRRECGRGNPGEPSARRRSRLWTNNGPLNTTITTIKRLSTASWANPTGSEGKNARGVATDAGGGIRVREEVKIDYEARKETDVECSRLEV